MTDHRGGYPAAPASGHLPNVPAGPAPGASRDGLTAAEQANLDAHNRWHRESVRLRCLEIAAGNPFRFLRNRGDDEQRDDAADAIALARRLEAYVTGEDEDSEVDRANGCTSCGRAAWQRHTDTCPRAATESGVRPERVTP